MKKQAVLTVYSQTLALKAQKTLETFAVPSRVVSVDPRRTKKGCSFGLSISEGDLSNADRILSRYGIKYSDILR